MLENIFWLGFVVTVMGKRIYYCGDTDIMRALHNHFSRHSGENRNPGSA